MQTFMPSAYVPILYRVPFSIRDTINAKNKGNNKCVVPLIATIKQTQKALKRANLL